MWYAFFAVVALYSVGAFYKWEAIKAKPTEYFLSACGDFLIIMAVVSLIKFFA